jgi:hypothetical protein
MIKCEHKRAKKAKETEKTYSTPPLPTVSYHVISVPTVNHDLKILNGKFQK